MRTDPKSRALDVCLRHLLSGASLEQVLELYPQWADELRPLLIAAQEVSEYGKSIKLPPGAQARSRSAFLQAAHARSRPAWAPAWRLGWAALVLLLVLVVGSITTFAVSAQALPGDPLYAIKLAAERTRLLLTENQVRRIQLEQSFDQERVKEVEQLIRQDRVQHVNFVGGLTVMTGSDWTVSGLRVIVNGNTHLDENLRQGYFVDVQGVSQADGSILAERIQPRTFNIQGTLKGQASGTWTVDGLTIGYTSDTHIQGDPLAGSRVKATVVRLVDNHFQALQLEVLSGPQMPAVILKSTQTPLSPTQTPQAENQIRPSNTVQPVEIKPPALPSEKDTETPDDHGSQSTVTQQPEPVEPTQVEPTHPPENEDHPTPEPTEVRQPTSEDQNTPTPTEGGHEDATPKPTEDDHEHDSSPTAQVRGATQTSTPTPTRVMQATKTPEATQGKESTETPKPTGEGEGSYKSPTPPPTTPSPNPTEQDHD